MTETKTKEKAKPPLYRARTFWGKVTHYTRWSGGTACGYGITLMDTVEKLDPDVDPFMQMYPGLRPCIICSRAFGLYEEIEV